MLIDASSLEEHRRAGFELISRVPLAFVWRQFASRHECDALVAHGEAARDFTAQQVAPSGAGAQDEAQISYGIEGFRRVVEMNGKVYAEVARGSDVEDLGGGRLSETAETLVERFNCTSAAFLGHDAGPHDDQWQNVVNCTPNSTDGASGPSCLLQGMHVDTYNDSAPRFATSLLYLRCPLQGGETLFASDVEAGTALLDSGVESTLEDAAERISVAGSGRSAARALEESARPLVSPGAGTLLLFFVRGPHGAVCPAGFHGSSRPHGGDKWTLQTFWAAPPGANIENYAQERFAHVLSCPGLSDGGEHAPASLR
jgi:hypothetical protein